MDPYIWKILWVHIVSAVTKQIYEWFNVSVWLSKWLSDNWCFTDLLTDRVIHYSNIYLCTRVVLWLMLEKIVPLMFSTSNSHISFYTSRCYGLWIYIYSIHPFIFLNNFTLCKYWCPLKWYIRRPVRLPQEVLQNVRWIYLHLWACCRCGSSFNNLTRDIMSR